MAAAMCFGQPPELNSESFPDEKFLDFTFEQPDFSIQDSLFNPTDFMVANHTLYVLDYRAARPVLCYDAQTGEFLHYLTEYGRGPNELTNSGPKRMSVSTENLYVLDSDLTFNVIPLHSASNAEPTRIGIPKRHFDMGYDPEKHQAVFRGSMTGANHLLYLYDYANKKLHLRDSLLTLHDQNPLRPLLNNPLLNQGPFHYDVNSQTAFVGFSYSTILVSAQIDDHAVKPFDGPNFFPLPKTRAKKNYYESPDATKHTDTYIDFATDSAYLYAVYSGVRWRTRDFIQGNYKLGSGKILRIFSLKSAEYIGSIELPYWTKRIAMTENSLFIYTESPVPQIIRYTTPDISRLSL
jgi:hypothetical protein